MTAPELSAQERETVARFEAAADAPESLRERVARALYEAEAPFQRFMAGPSAHARYCRLVDAALAVMRGDR